MRPDAAPFTFHLIHHTHWDREWYLPREVFRTRLIDAMRDLLDLLEADPQARFVLDGQTVLVEDTLALHPEWHNRFRRAVAAGQLEIGPWYVLADELIPAGESLLRNLLVGTAQAIALGGAMPVLYSPDAFGHPGALPMLAREFGMESAVVWRGLGAVGADRDLYRWRGPDDRDVLLYHLPPAGYEVGVGLLPLDQDFDLRWRRLRATLVTRATTPHVPVFIGADHHAPLRNPAALANRLGAIEAGHVVRWSTLRDYFDAVREVGRTAPVLRGELRASHGHTWALQGVHTTRSRLKRRHGLTELALQRRAEVLYALSAIGGEIGDDALLPHAWRTMIQCQFHDTLAGCCSDAVAREQDVRLTAIQSIEREVARQSLNVLAGHDPEMARDSAQTAPRLLLWNPAARNRQQILVAAMTAFRCDVLVGPLDGRMPRGGPGHQQFALQTDQDELIDVQVLDVRPGRERVEATRHYPDEDNVDHVRFAFAAPAMGGMSVANLTVVPSARPITLPAPGVDVRAGRLSNRFIEVHMGRDGRVDLIDRRSGERFFDVLRLIDEDDAGDSYTPDIRDEAAAGVTSCFGGPRTIATGPLVAAVQFDFDTRGGRTLRTRGTITLVLHADSPVLRVRIDVDNRVPNHRLRVVTAVGCGETVTAGAAFGFEERAHESGGEPAWPREHPLPTAPAQRFVMTGEHDRALAFLFPGFVEYEWTPRHELVQTVFRSVGDLSRDDVRTRPGMAGWTTPIPDAQEFGRHVHEFALASIDAVTRERPAAAESLWEDTFLSVQTRCIRDAIVDPMPVAPVVGIELDGDGLVFSALKIAASGEGLVLRCYNTEPAAVDGRWRFAGSVVAAKLMRADETVIGSIEAGDDHTLKIRVPGRGLSTVWVQLMAGG